jgi:predicted negative regulator of RcsB-dependent stress response
MRVACVLVVAACAARSPRPTLPGGPASAPAHDLAAAKTGAAPGDARTGNDPRVVDLDIIRITARQKGPGGDVEVEHVATADLFREANDEVKAGRTDHATQLYRQIVDQFPDSQFAAVALFDIAAIYDGHGDVPATLATLRELVEKYPHARESVEGHLYMAAVQSEHSDWSGAIATLDGALARGELTYVDRIEAFARKGYALIELKRYDDASAALDAASDAWRKAPRVDDPYYIAMARYYQGELLHRKFADAPVRLPDDRLVSDLQAKRALAVAAYDDWKQALDFKQAYWASAAGYQMSQIFVELWEATVKAPYPTGLDVAARAAYVIEVHARVRELLEKALDGHRMNIDLAKAYGVETQWSRGSERRAAQLMELLARDGAGKYITPDAKDPVAAAH